jgi:hypothetical protein
MRSGGCSRHHVDDLHNIDDGPGEQRAVLCRRGVLMTPLKLLDLAHASLHGGTAPPSAVVLRVTPGVEVGPIATTADSLSQRSMVIWMPLARALRICLTMTREQIWR